jgi:hypothetical protein
MKVLIVQFYPTFSFFFLRNIAFNYSLGIEVMTNEKVIGSIRGCSYEDYYLVECDVT